MAKTWRVAFEVVMYVHCPDDAPEQARQIQRQFGDNYIRSTDTDDDIIGRWAELGMRGIENDEALTPELNAAIRAELVDCEAEDIQLLD